MIMATVTLALVKYANVLFGVSPVVVVIVAGVVTVVFSAAGGLLGVLFTDLILFVVSMTGAVLAAWFAVHHPSVGGLEQLMAHDSVAPKLGLLPDLSDPNQYVPLLLVPLLVQWWSAWYPGSEPGGGGYVAQRMLAARDERHATGAAAFFNLAHYALRPWPWILVALASLVVFPDLSSIKTALPHVADELVDDDLAYPAMLTFLPPGLLGLVVASIIAAYVSTISTSLNLGSSYIVNDVYVRFINPDASERSKVFAGRSLTALLMVLAGLLALALQSAVQGFQLLLSVGAGTGLLFFLRWFWQRINAWSEIAAMVVSFAVSAWLHLAGPPGLETWQKFSLTVGLTTMAWIAVTVVTPRTDAETLQAFAERLRRATGVADPGHRLRRDIGMAVVAIVGVYALLFGCGWLLMGVTTRGLTALVVGAAAVVASIRYLYGTPYSQA